MTEMNERSQDWYDTWKALSLVKSFVQATCGGDPDSRQIVKLLDVAQYMSRLNTIVINDDGTADMSLLNTDDITSAQKLVYILENIEELSSKVDEEFEKIDVGNN